MAGDSNDEQAKKELEARKFFAIISSSNGDVRVDNFIKNMKPDVQKIFKEDAKKTALKNVIDHMYTLNSKLDNPSTRLQYQAVGQVLQILFQAENKEQLAEIKKIKENINIFPPDDKITSKGAIYDKLNARTNLLAQTKQVINAIIFNVFKKDLGLGDTKTAGKFKELLKAVKSDKAEPEPNQPQRGPSNTG